MYLSHLLISRNFHSIHGALSRPTYRILFCSSFSRSNMRPWFLYRLVLEFFEDCFVILARSQISGYNFGSLVFKDWRCICPDADMLINLLSWDNISTLWYHSSCFAFNVSLYLIQLMLDFVDKICTMKVIFRCQNLTYYFRKILCSPSFKHKFCRVWNTIVQPKNVDFLKILFWLKMKRLQERFRQSC